MAMPYSTIAAELPTLANSMRSSHPISNDPPSTTPSPAFEDRKNWLALLIPFILLVAFVIGSACIYYYRRNRAYSRTKQDYPRKGFSKIANFFNRIRRSVQEQREQRRLKKLRKMLPDGAELAEHGKRPVPMSASSTAYVGGLSHAVLGGFV